MYRVILVDDERLILRGLSTILPWQEMSCEIVGTATDGREGLTLIREKKPDILFTDIRMPNLDGLRMLAALGSEFPRMQIAVLTAYRDFDYARQALSLGVCRYLLKPSDLEELREAIRFMTARLDRLPPPQEENPAPEETASPEEESAPEREAGNFLVSAALSYMRDHCHEQHLPLGEVAEQVYVSQWHLSRLLNRVTGKTFFDLLGGMRIEKAKELLQDPGVRIQDVAEQTGYADLAHFSKSFKKHAGMTPGMYRNRISHR